MASTTTAITAPTNRRLLTLPPELRNRIYRFCTVYDAPVVVIEKLPSTYQYPDLPIRWKPYHVPALALTNYQLRTEVLSIYYSANTFQLFSVNNFTGRELEECEISLRRERLRHWVKHIGPSVKHLQNITLALLRTPTNEFTEQAASRAYKLAASINAKGRVDVELLYNPKNHRLIKFHLRYPHACVCGIEARVNPGKRSKKRMDGKALIEAATEVYEHFTNDGYEIDCKKCGRQVFFAYI